MDASALADRLSAGETLISGWSAMPEPLVAEAIARAGFDCVTFDIQHGLHDAISVMRGITAVTAVGVPALVRIALGDNATAARVLDMGAEAVIAPMINSAAEARALIAATKYPPVGERSWGPNRAMTLRGTAPQAHLDIGNASALVFAMVETRRAVGALDEILAVDGLDGVFVGPSDLSVTFSDGKKIAPLDAGLDNTIAAIAAKAIAAGRFAGAFAASPQRARQFAGMGYRLIALGADSMYLDGGARAMLAAARPV